MKVKLGSKVWVKDVDVQNPDVFVLATLKGVTGRLCQVTTVNGDTFDTDAYFPARRPSPLPKCQDSGPAPPRPSFRASQKAACAARAAVA